MAMAVPDMQSSDPARMLSSLTAFAAVALLPHADLPPLQPTPDCCRSRPPLGPCGLVTPRADKSIARVLRAFARITTGSSTSPEASCFSGAQTSFNKTSVELYAPSSCQ